MQVYSQTTSDPKSVVAAAESDSPMTLVSVFATRAALTEPSLLAAVASAYPTSVVVGCSTAGHFVGDMLEDNQAVIIAARFEHTNLRSAVVPLACAEDSRTAGEKLAAELDTAGLRAVLVLSDGTNCNGSALVEGLRSNLGDDVVIFGGLAADGDAFVETVTVGNGVAQSGQVVAVGLAGDRLIINTGSQGGWDLFGPERLITASSGPVLHELDGELALDLYRRYLGDRADELPGSALLFPLAIREPEADLEHRIVRTVLGIDEQHKTMTFAGDIPDGWRAQLMRASFDSLVDGAADAAEDALSSTPITGQSLCLGVSCVGRRLVLGSRTEEELDVVTQALPDTATFAGFYSYGEIAPGHTGHSELHNQTMTLTVIGES